MEYALRISFGAAFFLGLWFSRYSGKKFNFINRWLLKSIGFGERKKLFDEKSIDRQGGMDDRNSWLDIENGFLEFLNERLESLPFRWCNCITRCWVFVGTNRRIRGGTCCGKIKKRARKPSLLRFEGERMGLGFYFSSFFSLWKMDRPASDWIEATEILKDVDEGWMEDGRCIWVRNIASISNRCIVSRKLNNYVWNGFLLLGDWRIGNF